MRWHNAALPILVAVGAVVVGVVWSGNAKLLEMGEAPADRCSYGSPRHTVEASALLRK
ncbi:MAG: hypothetical protein AAFX99_24040 [Myxococcota bacterium]